MSFRRLILWVFIIFLEAWSSSSFASFIETTQGTAVVNDAAAAYFNPAALVLVKNSQIIPLVTIAKFDTQFKGQSIAVPTGIAQSGSANSTSYYYSPNLYIALPVNRKISLGFAVVSNYATRNPEENSILRYTQSSNAIQDYDYVSSIGVRLNEYLALGAGINFSYLKFTLHPIVGFPGSNIADSESTNQSDGSGIGGNIGLLLQPSNKTLIGFDYRSLTTYHEAGKSSLNGVFPLTSNNYHFKMRSPARSVLSINQMITPKIGIIGTVQRIYWSIIKNINVYGVATSTGSSSIITNAAIPHYLHDTWLLTLGGHYRFKPDWIVRIAATYNQSPNNGYYQLSTGDSYILGASLGYDINKTMTIDGSYAHAFVQTQKINISGNRFIIQGNNNASRDSISLKLTFNL